MTDGFAEHGHPSVPTPSTHETKATRTSPLRPSRHIGFGRFDGCHGGRGGGGEALGCSLPSCGFVHDFPCGSGLDGWAVVHGGRGSRHRRRGRWFLGLGIEEGNDGMPHVARGGSIQGHFSVRTMGKEKMACDHSEQGKAKRRMTTTHRRCPIGRILAPSPML